MKPQYSTVDELVRNEDLEQLKNEWLSVAKQSFRWEGKWYV